MLLIYNRDGKGGKRRNGMGSGRVREGEMGIGGGDKVSLGRSIKFLKEKSEKC